MKFTERGSAPRFPLPLGHKFGPKALALDVRFHTAEELSEQLALQQWQHHVMLHWLAGLKPNGQFDGVTQAAVVEVQRVSGINLTGYLDQDTWEATFNRGASGPSDPVGPETALESTESDENAEGVPQGTLEDVAPQNGSQGAALPEGPNRSETVVPVQPTFVKRGPGRPPKR